MMKKHAKLQLLFSMLIILFVPLVGSLMSFGGLPSTYGEFPAQNYPKEVPFSPALFWIGVLVVSVISLFFLFPRLFGFKKNTEPSKAITPASFPWWFYGGLIVFAFSFLIFWGQLTALEFLDPYMFLPVWWGVIIAIDGVVYKRKGGKSIISSRPRTMVLLAVISSGAWFMFEYLNFFILNNWYYPFDTIFTPYGNIVWYLSSYTVIFPLFFETIHLLKTFPGLTGRYKQGPKVSLPAASGWFFIAAGLAGSFLMGFFPIQLFFMVWLNPILILAGILGVQKQEHLFTPIARGDWRPVIIAGIAMVLCGIGWEMLNFGSEKLYGYQPLNPSYWRYSVPYVGEIRLPFSEMPILGYWGYIAYGWVCWLQWTWASKLFEFDTSTEVD